MASYQYTDIKVEVKGQIGIIKFNRPKALNSFGGNLLIDTIHAIRELDSHPDTVFTVLTGEGRFFSAGADVRAGGHDAGQKVVSKAQAKVENMIRFSPMIELMRLIIDHTKVFVLALNGPGVGGGAAWIQGIADIVLAADNAYLQVPFNALGLVPEAGASTNFSRHIGVHRSNDFFIFGRKVTAQEMESWGMINYIFPVQGFHDSVVKFLEKQLSVNDGKSMMESKRLQNLPLRNERMLAVYNATEALAERFVDGAPVARFKAKKAELEAKSKSRL